MKGLIFNNDQPGAQDLANRRDVALGYPFDGQDIGAGVHADPAQSRTLRRADVIAHPHAPKWAIPLDNIDLTDPRIPSQANASEQAQLATAQNGPDLTPDWFN